MAAHVSKKDADYSKGMKTAHCGICQHYRDGACTIVVGEIDPDYWCKYFKKRRYE